MPLIEDGFDPSSLNDPVAMQTQWKMISRLHSGLLRDHNLVKINNFKMEFKATIGCRLLFLIPLIFLIFFTIYFLVNLSSELSPHQFIVYMVVFLLSLAFMIAIGCIFYLITMPVVFDMRIRAFWKGRKTAAIIGNIEGVKHFTKYDDIHALQLLSKYSYGKTSGYNYELNVVLKNGNRINLVSYRGEEEIEEDCQVLSKFLDKPVWNAI
jgi:hypothetical protein